MLNILWATELEFLAKILKQTQLLSSAKENLDSQILVKLIIENYGVFNKLAELLTWEYKLLKKFDSSILYYYDY